MSDPELHDAIRAGLADQLPPSGLVIEIASGRGEGALALARSFPNLAWQPTENDPDALAAIESARAAAGLNNLLRPIAMDVTSSPWPVAKADAVIAIDFVHAAPIDSVVALFANAARVLPTAHLLHVIQSSASRLDVKDIRELTRIGTRNGFGLPRALQLPAHAHAMIFTRDSMPPPTGQFRV